MSCSSCSSTARRYQLLITMALQWKRPRSTSSDSGPSRITKISFLTCSAWCQWAKLNPDDLSNKIKSAHYGFFNVVLLQKYSFIQKIIKTGTFYHGRNGRSLKGRGFGGGLVTGCCWSSSWSSSLSLLLLLYGPRRCWWWCWRSSGEALKCSG